MWCPLFLCLLFHCLYLVFPSLSLFIITNPSFFEGSNSIAKTTVWWKDLWINQEWISDQIWNGGEDNCYGCLVKGSSTDRRQSDKRIRSPQWTGRVINSRGHFLSYPVLRKETQIPGESQCLPARTEPPIGLLDWMYCCCQDFQGTDRFYLSQRDYQHKMGGNSFHSLYSLYNIYIWL